MYGTQANSIRYIMNPKFENDVKMYGTQARQVFCYISMRLRMM